MKTKRLVRTSLEVPLSWMVVLGVAEADAVGWNRVRSAQLAELIRLLPLIVVTSAVVATTIVVLLWNTAPRTLLLGWAGALIAILVIMAALAGRARASLSDRMRPGTMARTSLLAIPMGLLWAVPAAFLSIHATPEQQLAICLISSAIVAASALAPATIPSVVLGFTGLTGIGLTIMLARNGTAAVAVLPLVYAGGVVLCALYSARAFMRRKLAEYALEEKSEVVSLLLREFEEHGADWLWQVDAAKQLVHVSSRFARAAGLDLSGMEGMPILKLLGGEGWNSGQLPPEVKMLFERLTSRESFSDLVVPVVVQGEMCWWNLSAAARYDERGNFLGFRGVGSDVTEQQRSAQHISHMARFDALTGLPNRHEITQALRRTLTRAFNERGRCALMLVDLDRFKAVNDTLGHPVGDKLLKQVADRLRALMDAGDVCGRLGGDEFAVAIADASDGTRLDQLGDAIIAAMTRPFDVDGHALQIGASVGTAIGPKDGRSVDTLLRSADLALYRAKDDGRGIHRRYEPRLLARAERRRTIETALRGALDRGQLRVEYFPVLEASGIGIEALEGRLRWHHPELGNIDTAEFVPVAEEARLMGRIGEWAIRTMCADATRWPEPMRVSINTTRGLLLDPQLPAMLLSALSHASLDPRRVELEVAESIITRDEQEASAAIDRLRPLGVRIALDGFGSGRCALSPIRPSRFDRVKIARDIVAASARAVPESIALIRAIVALASELKLDTTALGVDSEEVRAIVQLLGCGAVQGEIAGAPLSAAEVLTLVADGPGRQVA